MQRETIREISKSSHGHTSLPSLFLIDIYHSRTSFSNVRLLLTAETQTSSWKLTSNSVSPPAHSLTLIFPSSSRCPLLPPHLSSHQPLSFLPCCISLLWLSPEPPFNFHPSFLPRSPSVPQISASVAAAQRVSAVGSPRVSGLVLFRAGLRGASLYTCAATVQSRLYAYSAVQFCSYENVFT